MEALKNIPSQTPPFRFESEKKNDTKFIYFRIAKKGILKYGANSGRQSEMIQAENYLSARTQLIRMAEANQQPDLIIIDLPFVKREVKGFIEWLSRTAEFSRIPVLYNKAFLNALDIKEISYSSLVDDIVDIEKNFSFLAAKATFLKEVKEKEFEHNNQTVTERNGVDYADISLQNAVRRFLDILVSSALILLLLPVFVLITLVIFLESRGPIFYISYRAGRGYKIFKFIKFRTMHTGADNQRSELEKLNLYNIQNNAPSFFKIKNDPRVTKIGAFLRNTSLDELPQLFNVLKGDMSIVGNRPLPLYEAATLTTNEWAERFMAPAGITGLWQIKKRGREDMSVEERISLDISYAKNNDLLKDLWIMAKTPTALFQKTNV
jgi:lipopolysaccharide/colanic/teichoic acid biosynthesis glycosyltransferase